MLTSTDRELILAETRDLWDNLRGERLFITGGTGFVGRWLLESFLEANRGLSLGARATVLSRDPEAFQARHPHVGNAPALAFISGDMRTFDFPAGRYSHVIHAGGPAGPRWEREHPEATPEAVVSGTERVLEFSRRHGAKRFLYVSSGAVYGAASAGESRIPEESADGPPAREPASTYGRGKFLSEAKGRAAASDASFEFMAARGFAFAGPYLPLDAGYAVGDFIRDALRGGPIRITGDGAARRSYLYAADMAVWLWRILLSGKPSRSYNVGSEKSLTIAELAHAVALQVDPSLDIVTARKPGESPAEDYVPSTRRARVELGLRETVALGEAIRRTVLWSRSK